MPMTTVTQQNVVLLGDSVFDNGAYVSGGRTVYGHLQPRLPKGWQATLLAVDGHTARDVSRQLVRLPPNASHLVISVGGNDALGQMNVLSEKAQSMTDALNRMAAVSEAFQRSYQKMLEEVLAHGLPTALCTIYYPRFPDPTMQRLAVTALAPFNDSIILEAFRAGIPLLDLRLICDDAADYANPIEPSVKGGEKIATAIATLLREHDFASSRTEVFTSGR